MLSWKSRYSFIINSSNRIFYRFILLFLLYALCSAQPNQSSSNLLSLKIDSLKHGMERSLSNADSMRNILSGLAIQGMTNVNRASESLDKVSNKVMTATTIWISIVGFCFALLNFILFISLGKTKKEAEELFKAKVENLIDKFNKELSNQLKAAQENTDKLNKEINDMHLIYIGEIQNRKQSTISLNNELRKIMSSKIPIEALTQAYDEVFEKEEKQNIIRHHIQDLKYSNDKVIKERAIYSITQYAPDSIGISEGIKILEEFFRTSSEDEELRRKAADSIKRLEEMKLSKV